jgi:predicted DNA-binding protein (MmcQ/YjbR family)
MAWMTRGHLLDELRRFAFGFPGAYEDHPWGESVAKVDGKVFVFFGVPDESGAHHGLTVKLPESREMALSLPYADVPGYRLGPAGWVTLSPPPDAPRDLLEEWIEESYRAVARKRRIAELDAAG